ncbi:hypothetical protein R1sor_021824 [Riccia sorocarpa]|uniref:Uncharacterized protein n=1 Tax=Riccia sorocarpa TaxID=122646 RepID=A0ABD3GI50_9MARC
MEESSLMALASVANAGAMTVLCVVSFKRIRSLTAKGSSEHCRAPNHGPNQIRELVSQFLCPSLFIPAEGNETETWYRNDCINGRCTNCGPDKMSGLLCPVYESGTRTEGEASHRWKRYEYEGQGMKDANGHEKKRLELVHVETPVSTFIQYLLEKLAYFVKHDHVQKWQGKQYMRSLLLTVTRTLPAWRLIMIERQDSGVISRVGDFVRDYVIRLHRAARSVDRH